MPESGGEGVFVGGRRNPGEWLRRARMGVKKGVKMRVWEGGQVFEPTSVARLIVIFILVPFNAD